MMDNTCCRAVIDPKTANSLLIREFAYAEQTFTEVLLYMFSLRKFHLNSLALILTKSLITSQMWQSRIFWEELFGDLLKRGVTLFILTDKSTTYLYST